MSYLHSPRLVFTGDFQSDVSTVNNDTQHYNNSTFEPSFQLPDDPGTHGTNGWWNPEGGAVFNFMNCTVKQVCLEDGTEEPGPAGNSLIGLTVGGAEGRPTGKMVDLDPDAQMVSALWCVQLRIYSAAHELLLQGDLDTTAFRDLQMRQTDSGQANGQPRGGTWTTVLTNVVWGKNAAAYPFLTQLKTVTQGKRLSLNLNAFGYYYNHAPDGRFSLGRIIGAIGPWFYGEPETFAPTRRLYGMANEVPGSKATFFTFSNFLTEPETNTLTLDLGSSFPVADALGTVKYNKPLFLAVSKKPVNAVPGSLTTLAKETVMLIGRLAYEGDGGWLMATGGIVSFRNLPAETMAALAQNQLLLLTPSAGGGLFDLVAREAVDGLVVRADNFVQRLDNGDTNPVHFYAYQWGRPLAGAAISLQLADPTPDTPADQNSPSICETYGNNFPAAGLTFAPAIVTDSGGYAQLSLTGNAIHSPRVYIDGQVYTLNYRLRNIPNDLDNFTRIPDAVVIHLRDAFEAPESPVWEDIAPTMVQYSNLYPIMSKYVVNLADPQALIAQKKILVFAFTRDINDSMHMPVTRDLSKAKRQTILKWLENPLFAEAADSNARAAFAAPAAPRPVNPVPAGTPLTESQRKFKEAVKAKSGAVAAPPAANAAQNQ